MRSAGNGLSSNCSSCALRRLLAQPGVPNLARQDHRHPIVDRCHELVGLAGAARNLPHGSYPPPFDGAAQGNACLDLGIFRIFAR
jgi:hypothetical protein